MSTSGPHDPWSPYPVQDWQSQPPPGPGWVDPSRVDPSRVDPSWVDPCWVDPSRVDPSWVDPSWAPPQPTIARPRPRWLPPLVIGLVCALVAGGFYAADRLSDPVLTTRAQRFVPADGDAAYATRTVPGAADTSVVTESARLTGVEIFTSLDATFGTAVLTASGLGIESLAGVPFWRTTTTQVGGSATTQQLVRAYQVDGPVRLLGESGPGVAHTYSPGLVELPADVRAGQSWSSEGTAGPQQTYRSELRAEAADAGCLQVRGTIAYADRAGKSVGSTTVDRAWCPGEGITRSAVTTGDRTATETAVRGLADPPPVSTVTRPVSWRDPAGWQARQYSTVSIDENYGPGFMTGSPSGVPPVLTASGTIVRANSSSDLVTFTDQSSNDQAPNDQASTEWAETRRMRPGGTVLSLTAFGDVVVATTSTRQVVGYTASGVRLWQHELGEVAYDGPVRVDDTRLVLADSGGGVRVLDIVSGYQRWQQDLRAEVKAAPVADGRAVVVADGRGNLTAFAPADGSELWQNELEVATAAIVGDTVVTQSALTLTALSIEDGSTRWMEPVTGTVDALAAFDGRIVLATQINTTIRAEDGTVQKVLDPYELLTVTQGHLVGWGTRQAEVLDAALAVVATIDTPDRTLTSAGNWPVAERSGVLLFAGDWTFQSWSEPS